MRLPLPARKSASPQTADAQCGLRCCDLAKIGFLLVIAAGFLCQGIIWLAM